MCASERRSYTSLFILLDESVCVSACVWVHMCSTRIQQLNRRRRRHSQLNVSTFDIQRCIDSLLFLCFALLFSFCFEYHFLLHTLYLSPCLCLLMTAFVCAKCQNWFTSEGTWTRPCTTHNARIVKTDGLFVKRFEKFIFDRVVSAYLSLFRVSHFGGCGGAFLLFPFSALCFVKSREYIDNFQLDLQHSNVWRWRQ